MDPQVRLLQMLLDKKVRDMGPEGVVVRIELSPDGRLGWSGS